MDIWYSNGTEVVFACGGGIFTSAAEAAAKVGGKVIGVDSDQSPIIDAYGEGTTITSAMKSLTATVNSMLDSIIYDGIWDEHVGKVEVSNSIDGDASGFREVKCTPGYDQIKIKDQHIAGLL